MQRVASSDIPPDLNSEKALSLLYPNIIREAFAIYGADLHNRSWLIEAEKKLLSGMGVLVKNNFIAAPVMGELRQSFFH